MNKIYRLIWNSALNTWVVASEAAKSHGKNGKRATRTVGARGIAKAAMTGLMLLPTLGPVTASAQWSNTGSSATGSGSVAIGGGTGAGASANTTESVAIGDGATATSRKGGTPTQTGATAIGQGAKATTQYGGGPVAIGAQSSAVVSTGNGGSPVAIGTTSNANGSGSQVAIGDQALANGTDAIAIGGHANSAGVQALGNESTAIGQSASALNTGSVAIGYSVMSSGVGSVAIGGNGTIGSTATGNGALAIGSGANATADNTVALSTGASAASVGAIAVGNSANASYNSDIAIGTNASANGYGTGVSAPYAAEAIGYGATANNSLAMAVGTLATASGLSATAIGNNTKALGDGSVAGGVGANAKGSNGVALGSGANAWWSSDIAMGWKAQAGLSTDTNNAGNIAIGQNASASGGSATAIGVASTATNFGVAMGLSSSATGSNSVALGYNTKASSGQTAALGYAAQATGLDATALGYGSIASAQETLAVSHGAVASAAQATAVGYKASASALNALAIGAGDATNPGAVAAGQYSIAEGYKASTDTTSNSGIAIGNGAALTGAPNGIAVGTGAASLGANSVGIGSSGTAYGNGAVAIGQNAIAGVAGSASTVTNGIAIGNGAKATGKQTISIGTGNVVSGANSGAFGDPTTITGSGSYSLGNNNTIANNNAFVIGSGVTTTQDNSVVLGNASTDRPATTVTGTTIAGKNYTFAGAGSAANGVVSVGGAGTERQIINVAAGDVSAKSTDAINGSQLYATNQAIAAAQTHYYSVNDTGTPVGNYNNDGATGRWSMAAGTAASAAGDQAVAVGNLANAASSRSIAIGSGASATNTNGDSIAIGGNASTTGYQTVGIGNDAVAATNNSVVVGPKASGSKGDSIVAIGDTVNGQGNYSVAIGRTATTTSDGAVAVGSGTSANYYGTAIGANAVANSNATAIGNNATANGGVAAALGYGSSAAAGYSTALGPYATTTGNDSVAVGVQSKASNLEATAIGPYATTSGEQGIAAGYNAKASAFKSAAFGAGASATATNSVALGASSTTTADLTKPAYNPNAATVAGMAPVGEVSVGSAGAERRVTNVAAGSGDTDAVNVSQLKAASTHYYSVNDGGVASGNYNNDGATGTNALAAGVNAVAGSSNSVAMGSGSQAKSIDARDKADNAIAIGNQAISYATGGVSLGSGATVGVLATNSVAIGTGAWANTNANNAVAIGGGAQTVAPDASAIGANSIAYAQSVALGSGANGGSTVGTGDVAVGYNASTPSNHGTAIGWKAVAGGDWTQALATAVGSSAEALKQGSTALGESATASAMNATALGWDSNATAVGGVAIGSNSVASTGSGVAGFVPAGVGSTQSAAIAATTGTQGAVSVGNASSGVFRQINGVAAGTVDSDAVNVAQLKAVDSKASAGWNLQANGGTASNVAPGGTVNVVNGNNINVTQNGNQLTIATADDVSFNSVTTGNTKLDTNGLTITGGPSFTATNIDAAGQQIHGVAAGTASTDAVNVSQLTQQGGDLTAKGLNFAGNSGAAVHTNLGDTLTIAGAATTAGTYSGNNLKTVTDPTTGAVNLQMADNPEFASVKTGNTTISDSGLTIAGGPSFTATNIDAAGQQIHGVAAGTASTDAVNVSQLTQQGGDLTAKGLNFAGNSGASVHTNLGDTLTIAGAATTAGTYSGNNLKTVTDPATGAVNLQMADNPEFTSVKTGNTTINDSGLAIAGGPSITTAGIDAGGKVISNVAPGVAGTDAVNVSQLTQQGGDLTAKGLNFAGNSGASVHTNLGDTLTIAGAATTAGTYSGNNLKTVTDPTTGAVNLQMADNPEFTSVKTGNTTIDNSGLTIAGGPSVTTAGIDAGGKVISNVAPGVAGTDAVNVDQLTTVDTKVDNVTNTVNNFAGDQSTSNTTVNGRGIRYVRTNDTGLPVSDAFAQGQGSTAVGYEAKSTGADALALGRNAQASADNSVALGANSTTTADLTTPAYNPGTGTIAGTSPVGEVSVGSAGAERRITNLAAGAADTDAVNVSQLKSATAASVADAVMYDNSTHNSVTLGGDTYNSTTKTGGTKITNVARGVNDSDAVNMSQLNETNQTVTNLGDTVNNFAGDQSTTNTTVNGRGIRYVRTNDTGLPVSDAFAQGQGSTAVGYEAKSTGADALALGRNAQASADNSVAVGANSTTTADLTTSAYNPSSTATIAGTSPVGEVSVGSAGAERRITNLAAGAADTDAVNVSQLKAVDGKVNNLDDRAVKYDVDPTTGAVNYNSVTLGGDTYNTTTKQGGTVIHNVAAGTSGGDAVNVDQLTAVDTKVDNVTNTVNNFAGDQSTSNTTINGRGIRYVRTNDTGLPVSDAFAQGQGSTAVGYEAKSTGADALALGRNAQASADNSVALGANSTTTADLTTSAYNPSSTATIAGTSPVGEVSVGSAGAERRITNLAAGAADTDAVNVSQLKSATAASVADAVMYDNSTHNSVTLGGDTYNSTTKTGGTVIHNVAAGTSGGDAVNVDQLNQQGSDLTSKGLNFAGNSGTAVHTNLGDTLTIAGAATTVGTYSGNNLKTVTDPATGAVNLQMADNPEFTSVKTGNTTINDSGLTINGGPSITTAGIDAGNTKIVNVAPGVAGTDAVNVDQLTTVDTKVDNVTNTVNNFAGDQSTTNTTINGRGIRYVRTNDAGLPVSDAFAQGQGSTAVGYEAKSTGADALALGRNAQASADNSVALGANSTTTADLTTPAYNPGTGTIAGPSPVGEVSVGSAGAERRITNLAAGAADTDAVNVSQLKSATAASVADAVMYDNSTHNSVTLGGDTYNTTTKQGGTVIHNVAAGTSGGDAVNVDQLNQQGSDLTSKGLNFAGNSGANVHRDLGDTLTIAGAATTAGTYSGNNLKTVTDPTTGAVNLQMADNPEFTSVKTGNTTIDNSGLTIAGGPSVTTAGIDAGGKVISNVAPGVAGTDAVNVDQLTTVDTKVDNVTNTVNNFAGDQSTSNTTVNGRGIRYVRTNDTGLPVSDAFAQGQGSTAVGYEAKSTGADALALGRNAQASADNSVALGANSTTTADLTTPAYNPGTGTIAGTSPVGEVSVGSAGAERRITNLAAGAADTDAVNVSQLKSATAASVADAVMYDNSTHNSVTLGGDTYNSTTKTGGTVIHNVAAGTSGGDAVNVDQLNQQGSDLTSKGLNFAGNSGTAVHTNLGDTLTIAGAATTVGTYSGNNLKTVTDPATGAVNLQMADNPEFTSVKTGNTTINDSGLTINGGPSITTAGIDAGNTKIVNVAPGVAGTDAVNVDQLTTVDTKVDNVTNTVNNFAGDQSTTNTTINGRGIRYVRTNDAGLPVSDAFAQGQGSTAVGYEAKSTGADALALGRNAQASADNSVALGANSTTTADLTTPAYNPGTGTIAGPSPVGEVSVGSAGAERRITNLAAGAADTDAVNVSQLKSATAASVADAVMYDNSTHNSVTLGGDTYNTTTKQGGTVIHNVAAGTSGGDAVNVDQLNQQGSDLTSKGLNFAGNSGASVHTNLGDTLTIAGAATTAGTYSGNNLKTVTDPATGAVNLQMADAPKFGTVTINDNGSGKITGVTAGTASTDAVNVSQLTQVADSSVKYDVDPTTGTVNYNSVTLGGDTYNTTTKTGGTVIHNVAAGTSGGDAVNVDQLNTTVDGAKTHYYSVNDNGVQGGNYANDGATGVNSLAAGVGAKATADGGVALGSGSVASTAAGVAGFVPQSASTAQGAAIAATTSTLGAVSVGDAANGQFRQITGVAAGTSDSDAVNVAQLKSVDQKVDTLDNNAVKYDKNTDGTTNYNSVTLGGDTYNTTTKQGGTVIHNVAAGTSGGDAVNVDQLNQQGSDLTSKGLNFAGNSGASVHTNLGDTLTIAGAATTAGTYSGNNLKTVTDPATGAVNLQMADAPKFGTVTINDNGSGKITGVTAGTASTDAVNVSQLTQVADSSVKYDVDPTTGTVNYNSVTLGGDTYNTTTKTGGTVIHNVAAGTSGGDAVNVDQLNQQGSDLTSKGLNFAGNSGTAVHTNLGDTLTIAGTATTAGTYSGNNLKTVTDPATGAVQLQMADAPKFGNVTINDGGSGKITGVTAGTAATDAVNVSQLTQVADSSVKYDKNTDGTTNYNSVTLGGDTYNTTTKQGGTAIHNVAAGTSGGDAVNVDQLNQQGSDLTSKGLNFAGNSGANVHRDLGDTLTIAGAATTAGTYSGNNLKTVTDPATGAVQLQMADNPEFASVKTGNTTIDNNGVTIAGGPSITTAGIDAANTKITNVAAGTNATDAVNVSQLTQTVDASKTHYYSVNDNGVQGSNYANDGATGVNSLAAGVGAQATVAGGVALGSGSVANTAGGVAGWTPANASTASGTAITATTSTLGAVSVGDATNGQFRQITGVAAGTKDSDAVNVAQLKGVDAKVDNLDSNAVKYDDSTHNSVTLGGDTYNTITKTGGTRIKNVAAGVDGGDAVNVDQLNASKTHYYSVNDNGVQGGNYANDGATGVNALAAGVGAKATADGGVALGSGSVASTAAGVAGFVPQSASTAQGAAIAATTSTLGAVSVGDAANGQFRQITGVAAGTADSDAVNVAQLKGVDQKVGDLDNSTVKYDKHTDGTVNYNSVTLGGDTYNTTTKQGGTVIHNVAAGTSGGDAVNVDQLNTTVDASKTHYYSVNDNGVPGANYANDGATGLNAMAMGVGASASTAGGVALGAGSVASTAGGIAGWVPTGADATLANAVMGTMGTAGAVSVGNPAAGIYRQITGVAAGTSASDAVNVAQLQAAISSVDGKITPDDGRNVKYDGTGNAPKDHVTLAGDTSTDGGKTGGTTISNVHQGDVSANSTDAVNGAQLYQTNTRVDNLETTVNNWGDVINKTEGNTRYFQADGTNTDADKAYVQAGTKGVASGANASVTGNNGVAMGNTASASGNNSTAIGANTKATHDNSVALGAGSETDRANSVSVGTAGNERQITNVAAGTAATDAVNVSQLQSGLNDVQNAAINYTNQQVNNVRRDAYAGTASAMAMAALPQATLPGRGMVAMGGGTYGGQSAVALGLSKMSESGRWVFKAQATSNTRGNVGVAAGAGFHW
ncbi:ESPR-type extended signal peptide-containing protein [Cupriavidus metallidurans]|nr:ESPR-type extended signal peptide-containing protein [Cupriavidus metallidurans]QWC91638.1 hypothetical protein KB891_17895 [Cupriavidus metallidurans]